MLFKVIATKRSGHHAIISWLLQQKLDKTHYVGDSYYSHIVHDEGFDYQETPSSILITLNEDNTEKPALNALLTRCQNKDIIFNIENPTKTQLNRQLLPYNPYYRDKDIPTIICIRDCYNLLASAYLRMRDQLNNIRAAWVKHCNLFLQQPQGINFILYNSWFTSVDYRQSICERLSLDFTDKGLQRVPHNGFGSSFDKTSLDYAAQRMCVLERYKAFQDNPYFLSLFSAEMAKLNRQIFGWSL